SQSFIPFLLSFSQLIHFPSIYNRSMDDSVEGKESPDKTLNPMETQSGNGNNRGASTSKHQQGTSTNSFKSNQNSRYSI
ncbi:hypothetical protein PENTCL1PPCAC_17459, partial [Pristionchus entomophagus]